MKEKMTTFEELLFQEGTPRLLVEYIKQHRQNLSLELRLLVPEVLENLPLKGEKTALLQKMLAQKALLLSSISSQALSEKTKKVCQRAGIRKVEDLCRKPISEVRHLGKDVRDELDKFLKFYDLEFKDEEPYQSYFSVEELLKRYPDAVKRDYKQIILYLPDNMRYFFQISHTKNIEELCTKSEKDILAYNGCGPRTVTDIIAFLRELGLTLKSDHPEKVPERPATSQEITDVLACKISDFNVAMRVKNVCRQANIRTVGDLITHSRMDLAKIRSCSRKTIKDLEDLLESLNLRFREEQ